MPASRHILLPKVHFISKSRASATTVPSLRPSLSTLFLYILSLTVSRKCSESIVMLSSVVRYALATAYTGHEKFGRAMVFRFWSRESLGFCNVPFLSPQIDKITRGDSFLLIRTRLIEDFGYWEGRLVLGNGKQMGVRLKASSPIPGTSAVVSHSSTDFLSDHSLDRQPRHPVEIRTQNSCVCTSVFIFTGTTRRKLSIRGYCATNTP